MKMARPNLSLSDIKRKITENIIVDPVKGCFLWQRKLLWDGYGRQSWNGKSYRVHRLVYILENGFLDDNVVIRHICDIRNCVNVNHMITGTTQENTQDRQDRNRHWANREELHLRTKLEWFEVLEIRRLYASGLYIQQDIAEIFGVTKSTISDIIRGERWGWLHPDYFLN